MIAILKQEWEEKHKELEAFKEETRKTLKELEEKRTKEMKEWKKEFKTEIDTIKKTLKETTLGVENLKKKSSQTFPIDYKRWKRESQGPKTTLKT